MARGELLSILGLYQFDNTLFDEIVIPNEINKDVLIENILLDCAELEIVYPNSSVMKSAIGIWSKSRIKSWNDMKNVLIVENYRPFINLERKEKGYDLETRNLNTKETESLNSTTSGNSESTINSTTTENSESTTSENSESATKSSRTNNTTSSSNQDLDSTTTNKVSAFNSSAFENKEQSIVDSTTTNSGSATENESLNSTATNSGTKSQESNGEITNETTNESSDSSATTSSNNSNIDNTGTIRKDYEHNFEGDSAMFTKQNIIEQEMEMRLKYDLYKIIIDEFKKKFCLLIY